VPLGSTCAAGGPRRGAATLAVMPTTRPRPEGGRGGRGRLVRGSGGRPRGARPLVSDSAAFPSPLVFSVERRRWRGVCVRWWCAGVGWVWEARDGGRVALNSWGRSRWRICVVVDLARIAVGAGQAAIPFLFSSFLSLFASSGGFFLGCLFSVWCNYARYRNSVRCSATDSGTKISSLDLAPGITCYCLLLSC
jgi:hypothetical protein